MWKNLDCLQPQKKMLKRFLHFPFPLLLQFTRCLFITYITTTGFPLVMHVRPINEYD